MHRSVLPGIALFVLLFPRPSASQPALTEAEAVARVSLESPRARPSARRSTWSAPTLLAARRWPNPRMTVSRESVAGVTENFLLVSQTLPVTGRRGLQIASAADEVRAAELRADDLMRRLRADARRAFVELARRGDPGAAPRGHARRPRVARRHSRGARAGRRRRRVRPTPGRARGARRGRRAGRHAEPAGPCPGRPGVALLPDARPGDAPRGAAVGGAPRRCRPPTIWSPAPRRPGPICWRSSVSLGGAPGGAGGRPFGHPGTGGGRRPEDLERRRRPARVVLSRARLDPALRRGPARAGARGGPRAAGDGGTRRAARGDRRLCARAPTGGRGTAAGGRCATGSTSVPKADELRRIARVSYDAGERGILELLDAYRSATDARLRLTDLEAAAAHAEIDLELATAVEIRQ